MRNATTDNDRISFRSRDRLPDPPTGTCEYFALCENPATTTVPNPVLGDVPACDRCAAKVAAAQ